MENDKDVLEQVKENLKKEHEPWIIFHAFPLEMWFWRIAVPVALICSIIALLR